MGVKHNHIMKNNFKEQMFTTLLQEKLKTMYPDTHELLQELAEATENYEVAMAVILGVYKQPEIAQFSSVAKDAEFISYDKYKDKVHFKYQKEIKKGDYFPIDVNQEDITLENFDELKCNYNHPGGTDYHYIPTGKYEEATSYTSLHRWQKDAIEVQS